ncbi:MAG TPA: glycosyltransferase family 2 protein [Acidimicrobiales bacterium]|nr:glycosyltransferase family 2 protein [Acidimicrobiales bacterium]
MPTPPRRATPAQGTVGGSEPGDPPERALLLELGRAGDGMAEAARSLAAGAVLRGRLTPDAAARLSPCTAQELRRIAPSGAGSEDGPTPTRWPVRISVVVPAFNEADNLATLWDRLRPVLDDLSPGELVVVDDGSSDATWGEVSRLAAGDRRVRGVRLSRNFGHQAAVSAGLAAARGDAVCIMDADLQDPPELLPRLVEEWSRGNQVVYAVRRTRQEGRFRQAGYRWFYRIYRRLADIDVPLDSGDFAVLDRRVVDDLLALPEHNRFLRGLRSWVGYRQVGVPYDRDARHAGAPKYTLRKLTKLALDGLVSFSAAPLRLASVLGMVVALAGGLYVGFAVAARVFFGGVPKGWTSIVAVILTIGGMQLLVMGVLGEYVARVYDETKARPNYLVAETTPDEGPAT